VFNREIRVIRSTITIKMMDDTLDQHPFMEQALLEDALLGEESSLDDSARAFSPLLVSEDQSNSEQSETRESQKSSPKNSKSKLWFSHAI
jgi:hypothetical protein